MRIASQRTATTPLQLQPDNPDDLDAIERRHDEGVLRKHGGNNVQTAKALGISRRALYRMIARYSLAEHGTTSTD